MNIPINEYFEKHAPHLKYIKEYFENLPIECIVYQAALSQKWDGKMFSHQYRVGIEKTKLAAKKLLEFESTILTVQTFEEIFHYTEKIRKLKIGVGPLWSYDTALRIGFHLKIYPTEVYIQAGVVKV